MKDPQDCTYPQMHLCPLECDDECRKRNRVTRARVTPGEIEEALAEDEYHAMNQKHEGQRLMLTCDQLGVCQDTNPPCFDCPRKTV